MSINFTHPWLLLLLIPAFALAFIPYFRLSRKYRRTRNRITSMVLNILVMIMAICLLSGLTFTYTQANEQNEIILLVDMSETAEQSDFLRDNFVKDVLEESSYDNYKVGVVTFGYDQVYAVPLTSDVKDIYNKYLNSELPDISATNIADALTYTATLFKNPETAKIVLITDGKETDGSALSNVRAISAQGIKVDVAYIPSAYAEDDVEILSVMMPATHVAVDEDCYISVTIQANPATEIGENLQGSITLYDNGTEGQTKEFDIAAGESQEIVFMHKFTEAKLHEIEFRATVPDMLEQNNKYVSYIYLEELKNVLIVEYFDGVSDALSDLLTTNGFTVTVANPSRPETIPKTISELLNYDQVILNDVANKDLADIEGFSEPEGFVNLLENFVQNYGGGMFTVGGNDLNGEAHAYKMDDLYATKLQSLMPIIATNYVPPKGVMIIIDGSGSMMSEVNGESKLEWAKYGAKSCVDILDERDYAGVMTLGSDLNVLVGLTPCTQRNEIVKQIDMLNSSTGSTTFSNAIERAGQLLQGEDRIDKRHIIVVTDGAPTEKEANYLPIIQSYNQNGSRSITLSIVGIGLTDSAKTQMERAVAAGGGKLYSIDNEGINTIMRTMRDDISAPKIEGFKETAFYPTVTDLSSSLLKGVERGNAESAAEGVASNQINAQLGGYYGSKARSGVKPLLTGEYEVPIYSQWQYGAGTVGSFMCDLKGTSDSWSQDFLGSDSGKQFIINVIKNIMPTSSIRASEIAVDLVEENYSNRMSVYASLNEGDYITGTITNTDTKESVDIGAVTETEEGKVFVTTALGSDNNYSRCGFVIKDDGIYEIKLVKHNKDGEETAFFTAYKTFSYSKEYDVTEEDAETSLKLVNNIAERGNGSVIKDLEDPVEVFANFVTRLTKTFDPTLLFAILIIVFMVADVFVRKFKFKWPHEIIKGWRDKSNKKASK